MERTLLYCIAAMGALGWLSGLLLTRSRSAGRASLDLPLPLAVLAVSLPFLVFLATLPSKPPFAPGHGLGWGFLIGGLGALLAGWSLIQARGSVEQGANKHGLTAPAIISLPYFVALMAVSAPLIWLRASLLDALMGVAIGWFAISMTLLIGWNRNRQTESVLTLPLMAGTGFAVALCALAALGEYHGGVPWPSMVVVLANGSHVPYHGSMAASESMTRLSWSVLGVAFAAIAPLLLLVSSLPSAFLAGRRLRTPLARLFTRFSGRVSLSEETRQTAEQGARLVVCILAALGAAKLIVWKTDTHQYLLQAVGVGLVVGAIAWGVTVSRLRQEAEDSPNAQAIGWQNGALAIFAMLCGTIVAYQLLAGLGVGLMLISAWLVVSFAFAGALEQETETGGAQARQVARILLRLLLFGLTLLFYRLFTARFQSDLRNVSLTDHYALFGLLVGATLPMLLAGYLARAETEPGKPLTAGSQALRLIVVGALALMIPAFVLILWGAKCALALFMGLALGIVLIEAPAKANDEKTALLPSLLALAIALALAQWAHHVLPYALLSRHEKIQVMAWMALISVALVLIMDYSGRLNDWMRTRRRTGVPAKGAAK